ncbi:hypothetical protein DGI_0646 [Megalodesulfovibrio gigas DSM 1382 = ATCC 19364]|uniref:Uncharacterized protein n=1 Tax=Megalodesulfovibrio gigas (strain ATCC 19364 / DSM 1382 / NCIMB 9332 / VKM B-1759) TaxID=1121448 RepID=T2G8F9_MEGG1|nr:hypothetical protein DGI_0646 [Megalodesulfovibrio gigas DSM 1382 = ATCC 19364]
MLQVVKPHGPAGCMLAGVVLVVPGEAAARQPVRQTAAWRNSVPGSLRRQGHPGMCVIAGYFLEPMIPLRVLPQRLRCACPNLSGSLKQARRRPPCIAWFKKACDTAFWGPCRNKEDDELRVSAGMGAPDDAVRAAYRAFASHARCAWCARDARCA